MQLQLIFAGLIYYVNPHPNQLAVLRAMFRWYCACGHLAETNSADLSKPSKWQKAADGISGRAGSNYYQRNGGVIFSGCRKYAVYQEVLTINPIAQ